MNRRTIALGSFLLLVVLAGCLGSGSLSEEDLTGDADYVWDTEETATYNLSAGTREYTAVIHVGNQSSLTIHRDSTFRGEQGVEIEALQFRFQNGTVVNATHPHLNASLHSDRTVINLPAENGSVAYVGPRDGKQFSTPVFIEGSHRVDLPESTRVGIPLLSQTTPGGAETTVENDRMRIVWDDLSDERIAVRYYLVRDLYIFGSMLAIGIVLVAGGGLYYWRQIRRARAKREEYGLDIEDDDIGDDGPPPGMR